MRNNALALSEQSVIIGECLVAFGIGVKIKDGLVDGKINFLDLAKQT